MSIAKTVVEQEAEAVCNPESAPTDVTPEMQAETELTAEISRLWGKHQKVATSNKKTRVQMQAIREELGRKLAEIKPLVCRMGRASEWGKFLAQHTIPKATGDRLVLKYGPDGEHPKKSLNEEVSLENEVQKFRDSVLKKGNRLLPHQYDKYHFFVGVAEEFGLLDRDGDLIDEPEKPEDDVEPNDDELGDDLLMPSRSSSDEVLEIDDEEPAIDGTDDQHSPGLGERKRQIEL